YYDQWLWQTYGILRDIQVTTLSFASVPLFVIGNERIATLPRRIADHYATMFPLQVLDLPFARPPSIQLVQWHRSRSKDPRLRWITKQLVQFGSASNESHP